MRLTLTAALLCGLAVPASAFDLTKMTDAERQAFRAEIRAYLLENPEVLSEAYDVLKDRQAVVEAEADKGLVKTYRDPLFKDAASWVGGNPAGDITLIKFIDYRCGYCRKSNAEVEELVKSDGNIRFILKEYPILGPESDLSSRFAIAVRQIGGDEVYKKAHDALITFRGDVTPEALDRLATDLGMEPAAVSARMNSPEVTAVIDANHKLGEEMQITGTPTFVIGGQMLRGYVPLDGMREIVAEERAG
jgi:protein-disulfide isomerase